MNNALNDNRCDSVSTPSSTSFWWYKGSQQRKECLEGSTWCPKGDRSYAAHSANWSWRILSSKPLDYVSSDERDINPVTPNVLLMGDDMIQPYLRWSIQVETYLPFKDGNTVKYWQTTSSNTICQHCNQDRRLSGQRRNRTCPLGILLWLLTLSHQEQNGRSEESQKFSPMMMMAVWGRLKLKLTGITILVQL